MGVLFNDPDVDLNDIYWYNVLSWQMLKSMDANEGLIAFDEELNTHSCYVELHRKGSNLTVKSTQNSAFIRKDFLCVTVTFDSHPIGINGRNAIVAFPPLKFLPIKEFEKRQKSIDHDTRMIMSSMMTKFGF